jgi:hypothetical protein
MKFKHVVLAAVIGFSGIAVYAGPAQNNLARLAEQALSNDTGEASRAIEELRAAGPAGLEALQRHAPPQPLDTSRGRSGWQNAVDRVSGQYDCSASRLYWYTDLGAARAEAKRVDKPILSLRLLGKLDEEFSCANSRFFRTTLYANREVGDYLREHFVLHWKSVRPVPKVTIDYGDGRKIERTITGNSIHYVLDSDGRVVDALPGLYSAKWFLDGLKKAEGTAKALGNQAEDKRSASLADYHRAESQRIGAAFETDLTAARSLISQGQATQAGPSGVPGFVSAGNATKVARSKGKVEKPVLRSAFSPGDFAGGGVDDATWDQIAALHLHEMSLDANAKTLIGSKNPTATQAGRAAISKSIAESPVIRVIRNLEHSIGEDTVKNEYILHREIHDWLAGEDTRLDVDALNSKVYAQLFLTPDSDPWLGLVPPDTFSALQNDGLAMNRK